MSKPPILIAQQPEACQIIVQPPAQRPVDNSIWVVSIEPCEECGSLNNYVSRELRSGAFISYCDHCRRRSSGKGGV